MSTFTTPLIVSPIDDQKNFWVLVERFEYHVGKFPSDEIVIVPKGFITDFASIPKYALWLFPPYHADYGKAAVLHDYLWEIDNTKKGRQYAAHVFKEALKVLKAPKWKRVILTTSVNLYTWFVS